VNGGSLRLVDLDPENGDEIGHRLSAETGVVLEVRPIGLCETEEVSKGGKEGRRDQKRTPRYSNNRRRVASSTKVVGSDGSSGGRSVVTALTPMSKLSPSGTGAGIGAGGACW
jgi:hypothetical protein